MHRRLQQVAQAAVVIALFAAVLVWPRPAVALMAPETLADRRPVQAGPVDPGFPVDYVGVLWDTRHGHDHHHADEHEADGPAAEPNGAVRFRHDGQWGPWIRLVEDGIEGKGFWASGLVAGGDADAYQVRGLPAGAVSARAVAINTTDGDLVRVGEARGDAAHAVDPLVCQSRAEWGAQEELRLDSSGNEVWPPAHYPVQALTVHHTATENNDSDPEATIRAIYRYHAVDQGWGDIGYQFLIDEAGIVYEGRWSGKPSVPCGSGGDGSDFGHEKHTSDGTATGTVVTDLDGDGVADEMVTGAHVGGANSGNLGAALLGEFTTHKRFGAAPKAAAVDALEDLLAHLSLRHGLNPEGTIVYDNPATTTVEETVVHTISGHQDWSATECPGERLYNELPTIRTNVATKMGSTGGDTGGGTSDPVAVSVSGTNRGSGSPLGVGAGQLMQVYGAGFLAGATVAFENGKGQVPVVTSVVFVDGGRLDATVTVEAKGPSGAWDVRVTNPDGTTAACSACAAVRR